MKIKSIAAHDNFHGQRVLMRVDFNVPIAKGKIKEDYKIAANLPMINYLLKKGAALILISHLGDPVRLPSGKIKNQAEFSLKPVASRLSKLLGKKVLFSDQLIGSADLDQTLHQLKAGQVIMLENLRFYAGETKNDSRFARQLAKTAKLYINNAFAVSHRAHASVAAVKRYLPAYAGALVEEEVLNWQKVLKPQRPLVAVIGGAKINTKVALIKRLTKQADYVLVGGAIANNFLAARGLPIGKSLASPDNIKLAKKIDNRKLILPIDVIVSDKDCRRIEVKPVAKVGAKDFIYDIGPETMKLYAKYIKEAKTIAWNGPMGLFEQPRLKQGTLFIARAIAARAKGRAFGAVGGGETIEALRQTGMIEDVDWVSTGGGASLTYLGGEKMPGLDRIVK